MTATCTTVVLLRLGVGIGAVAAWQAVAAAVPALHDALSSPAEVAARLGSWLAGRDGAWGELGATLLATGAGLAAGIAGAVLLLVVVLAHRRMAYALAPFVAAANAVPKVVLVPLLIVWFGVGMTSKLVFVATVVGFVVFYNLFAGVQAIDVELRRNVAVLGASPAWTVRVVTIPSVLGWLAAGLRASGAFALLAAVLAEYLGSNAGLGHLISQGQAALAADTVVAGMLVVGLLAVGLDRVLLAGARIAQPWRQP